MRRAVSVLLPLAVVLAGCPSSTLMHTAKPVRVGQNQIGINAVGYNPRVAGESVTFPTFEIQLRRGLSEKSDFGAKYSFPLTISLDYNLLLVDSGVAISIDPSLSPMYISSSTTAPDGTSSTASAFWAWGFLPVLIDVVNNDSMALTLSPRVGFLYASGVFSEEGMDFATSGTSGWYGAGLGLKINAGQNFAIMPEISLLAPFDGGVTLVQGAVGFLF